MHEAGKDALAEVLGLLELEQIEENIFRGLSPKGRTQRVFGGQVLGQALAAAIRTGETSRPAAWWRFSMARRSSISPPPSRCRKLASIINSTCPRCRRRKLWTM